jgi:glycosyltransferase involved in cell wall biosynthesis
MLLSVIIPCFNEETVLRDTYRRVSTALGAQNDFEHELLFVDDGSSDSTPRILQELSRRDPHVRWIRFSRNFGHQPAVSAGIRHAKGDLAVIIDADLQDPPEVIPEMIRQLRATGSNVVYAVRRKRKGETLFKRVSANIFYRILSNLSEVPLPVNTGDFRVIDRTIINAFNKLQENNKYVRGLISWMGFKQTPFYYDRDPRYAGSPKYNLKKLVRLASTGIFYFSKKPLKLSTTFGFMSVGAGLLLSLWVLINKLATPQYIVSGWTSIILLMIYFGGVQLLTIGILGQYIGSLFDEVKRRPEYILDEQITVRAADDAAEAVEVPDFHPPQPDFADAQTEARGALTEVSQRRVHLGSSPRAR